MLELGGQDVSLDDIRGGAVCLLDTPKQAFLSLEAAPGQTYRLLRASSVRKGSGEEQVEQMRGSAGSAVRGRVLRRLSEPVMLMVNRRNFSFDSYLLDL